MVISFFIDFIGAGGNDIGKYSYFLIHPSFSVVNCIASFLFAGGELCWQDEK